VTRSLWTLVMVPLLVLLGVPILIAGFALNPGPPAGSSLAQMTAFGAAHAHSILLGGWLQIMGTVMASIFALVVVNTAGATARLTGVLSLFGVTLLVGIGLAEMAAYVLVTTGSPSIVNVGAHLIIAVQHGYGMIGAPLVFLPLGFVILKTGILGRALGWIAVTLGAIFFIFGFLGVLLSVQTVVDLLSSLQGIWWVAAGINWIQRVGRTTPATVDA
jgi:hypothetical protein